MFVVQKYDTQCWKKVIYKFKNANDMKKWHSKCDNDTLSNLEI